MSDNPLRDALDSPDARVTLAAALELTRVPPEQLSPAFAALAQELSSGTHTTQRRAALVCGVLGQFAVGLAPHLRDLLTSPRWAVRESALHALARVDDSEPTRAAAASCAVLDRSAAVRAAALELLALRPNEMPAAVSEALTHRHPRVRCRALRAVARLAPSDHVGTLNDALLHSHQRVRRTAAQLLGGMGTSAVVVAGRLARCRCDGDAAVASAARLALERLRPHLPDAFEPLCGSEENPLILLDVLLSRVSEDVRQQLDSVRRVRRERIPDRDERAEARWLIGRLVEMLTTPRPDNP